MVVDLSRKLSAFYMGQTILFEAHGDATCHRKVGYNSPNDTALRHRRFESPCIIFTKRVTECIYSNLILDNRRTPLIRINWDGELSEYVETFA